MKFIDECVLYMLCRGSGIFLPSKQNAEIFYSSIKAVWAAVILGAPMFCYVNS